MESPSWSSSRSTAKATASGPTSWTTCCPPPGKRRSSRWVRPPPPRRITRWGRRAWANRRPSARRPRTSTRSSTPCRRTGSPTSTCRSPPTRFGRLYDRRESPSEGSAIADDVLELLREYAASGGSLDIFVEPRLPKPLLLVFGESPAADTMIRLAELTGFRTRAVSQAEIGSLEIPPGDGYAVVATMGHYDEEALEAALIHPDLDVSLIASTRRASAARQALLRRGLDEHTIARIHTSPGKIRGTTQEEIALLALADIVAARRKRGAKPVTVEPSPVTFVTDPVCGMTVDPLTATHKAVHAGRTFWFCSAGCQSEFDKEPERYLRAIEA